MTSFLDTKRIAKRKTHANEYLPDQHMPWKLSSRDKRKGIICASHNIKLEKTSGHVQIMCAQLGTFYVYFTGHANFTVRKVQIFTLMLTLVLYT